MRRLNDASGRGLDEIVRQVLPAKKLFIGGDFNGHIGATAGGYGKVHGGFCFGERNGGGTSLLDFAKAFGLVIANSNFPKRKEHLVTFQNEVVKTQIDYLLLRRCDSWLCKDCKMVRTRATGQDRQPPVPPVGVARGRGRSRGHGRGRGVARIVAKAAPADPP
uniref:Craniofacial development protein 2-like n=1 Tax=Nicotiana tabacum TaxID=4097 RepID=A0A1S4CDG2_TOBAC